MAGAFIPGASIRVAPPTDQASWREGFKALSSQQQSSGYKRRSSGKRTRRPASVTTPVAEPQDGTGGTDAAIATHAVEPATAKPAPRNGAGTRSRATAKTAATQEPSKWKQLVDLDRFEGLRKFIRETWAEIKKVIWPDRETTRNLTLVVIAVSVVLGILLGGIDYVLFQLFEALP
jgi:preprotein translocase subunit SecE